MSVCVRKKAANLLNTSLSFVWAMCFVVNTILFFKKKLQNRIKWIYRPNLFSSPNYHYKAGTDLFVVENGRLKILLRMNTGKIDDRRRYLFSCNFVSNTSIEKRNWLNVLQVLEHTLLLAPWNDTLKKVERKTNFNKEHIIHHQYWSSTVKTWNNVVAHCSNIVCY